MRKIFQLKNEEIEAMIAAGNIQAGDGIVIEADEKGLKIGIDKEQLKQWIYKYLKNACAGVVQNYNELTLANFNLEED